MDKSLMRLLSRTLVLVDRLDREAERSNNSLSLEQAIMARGKGAGELRRTWTSPRLLRALTKYSTDESGWLTQLVPYSHRIITAAERMQRSGYPTTLGHNV